MHQTTDVRLWGTGDHQHVNMPAANYMQCTVTTATIVAHSYRYTLSSTYVCGRQGSSEPEQASQPCTLQVCKQTIPAETSSVATTPRSNALPCALPIQKIEGGDRDRLQSRTDKTTRSSSSSTATRTRPAESRVGLSLIKPARPLFVC